MDPWNGSVRLQVQTSLDLLFLRSFIAGFFGLDTNGPLALCITTSDGCQGLLFTSTRMTRQSCRQGSGGPGLLGSSPADSQESNSSTQSAPEENFIFQNGKSVEIFSVWILSIW